MTLLCLMFICAIATHSLAEDLEGQNLLSNASFELGETMPDKWKTFEGEEAGEYRWEEEGYESERSVSVLGNTNKYHGGWMQIVSLEPKSLYRIVGYAKGSIKEGRATVCLLEMEDKDGRFYSFPAGFIRGESDWKRYEGYAVCPAPLRSATFYPILLHGIGKAFVDEVSLEKVKPFVLVKEEAVVIGIEGALFLLLPDGSIKVWGEGANCATFGFSCRIGDKDWLSAGRFKDVWLVEDSKEVKAVKVRYELVRADKKQVQKECELESEIKAKLVEGIPCLSVKSRFLNLGSAEIDAYMFYHISGEKVELPDGEEVELEKWGGLARAKWYLLKQSATRADAKPYCIGVVALDSRVDKGPKHINVFAPQYRKKIKEGEGLEAYYAVVITDNAQRLNNICTAMQRK